MDLLILLFIVNVYAQSAEHVDPPNPVTEWISGVS